MDSDTATMALVLGLFTLATVVVVVVIWQGFATWRSRAALTREREYQRIAETSTAAHEKTSRQLGDISDELTELQGRIASIERALREVD